MGIPKFKYFSLENASSAEGAVVVIDVLRAFTTAAYALDAGALRIYPVGTVAEAVNLKGVTPNALIMGEVGGRKPEGFDLSNSPAEIKKVDVSGKNLIQRTSAGTQGIITARNAQILFAASFVVAGATAKYLRRVHPAMVSVIVTGKSLGRDGDEDRACGEYIEALTRGQAPDPKLFTARVMSSSVGQAFRTGQLDYLSQEDILLSLDVSRFGFYMRVDSERGRLVIKTDVA